MSAMPPPLIRFDTFTLDLDRLCVIGASGELDLRPKSFEVLRYLVEHRGRVVFKEEVMESVWPDVTVSDESLARCISEIRSALGDKSKRIIKTVPKRGYLFDARIARGDAAGAVTVRADRPDAGREGSEQALQLPDRPSIAVLPFANLGSDPNQDYLSDGITEDITTALSRIHWLFVIARNSSFFYKGRVSEVKQIARDLGVRYILEGSVRKVGGRVRISSQLIDAAKGAHLWAERYDCELPDIFAMQDEIAQKVAAAIEPRLLTLEGTRAQACSLIDLDAWELVARASSIFWRMTKPDTEAAIALLTEAVERHPAYGLAHSMLAFAILIVRQIGWRSVPTDLQIAGELTARAAELDSRDPWAHLARGQLAVSNRETDAAVFAFARALELNPNFATAHGRLGSALAYDGRPERALQHLNYALRLSPYDPQNAFLYGNIAMAHYQARRYGEAVEFAGKAVRLRPAVTGAYRVLCAGLAMAGRIDDARAALQRIRRLQPTLSLAWVAETYPLTELPMQHFLDGLRKSGLQ
jgi:TolB-like protein/Tfp pilus assembly protein PilF